MAGVGFLAVGLILSAATTAVAGYASYQQGQFQADVARTRADFASKVHTQNAEIAKQLGERNAKAAIDAAASRERLFRRSRSRQIANARAAFGASGVQLAGTPLEVLSDAITSVSLDAHLIRHGGQVAADDARLQAQLAIRRERIAGESAIFGGAATAELFQAQGRAAALGAAGEAGGTLLGGIFELDKEGFFGP